MGRGCSGSDRTSNNRGIIDRSTKNRENKSTELGEGTLENDIIPIIQE